MIFPLRVRLVHCDFLPLLPYDLLAGFWLVDVLLDQLHDLSREGVTPFPSPSRLERYDLDRRKYCVDLLVSDCEGFTGSPGTLVRSPLHPATLL